MIFGATGDLTKRKLVPALYALAADGQLPPGFSIVGAGRTEQSTDEFREAMRESVEKYGRVPLRDDVWNVFADGLRYCSFDLEAEDGLKAHPRDPRGARPRAGHRRQPHLLLLDPAQRLRAARRTARRGGPVTHPAGGSYARMVVEKPFGHNLQSARELNNKLHAAFNEEQIYRIDHYLGKETVQNLLVFRFANGIFEPLWNRQYIDHVQITVAENIGVEGRGAYYEESGALRDIIQNHVMQLMAIVGMEAPSNFRAETVRDEKVKLLRAVRPIHPDDAPSHTVRGQYGPGWIDGERVRRLPRGAGRQAGLRARDLRGHEGGHRQLALGRNAVLPAHRQAPAQARHRDRHPVPACAALAVRRQHADARGPGALGQHRSQPAGAAHPARRGHHAALRRQGAGAVDAHPHGQHGLPLRQRVPQGVAGGVRAAAARLHARRRHPVRARGRGGGGVALLHRHPRRLARPSARRSRTSPTTRPASWGPQSSRDFMARDGRQWRRL